jgi:hypothetical protein
MFSTAQRSTKIKLVGSMLSMPDGEMMTEILSSDMCCKRG